MQKATSSPGRSHLLLWVAYAAFGLALAMAIAPISVAPAPADQLPGFMSAIGLDASGPMRTVVLAILLPFLVALAAPSLIDRLTTRWSQALAGWGAVASLALAIAGASLGIVVLTTGATAGMAIAWRQADPRRSCDAVLRLTAAL